MTTEQICERRNRYIVDIRRFVQSQYADMSPNDAVLLISAMSLVMTGMYMIGQEVDCDVAASLAVDAQEPIAAAIEATIAEWRENN